MPARSAPSARPRPREGRAPRLAELLNGWGGVTIAYRRRLIDCAELHAEPRGSGEGAGGGHPLRRGPDAGRGRGRRLRRAPRRCAVAARRATGGRDRSTATLPARTILVAAGTQPNTVLAREDADARRARRQLFPARSTRTASRSTPERVAKPDDGARADEPRRRRPRHVSFFGDLHPSFAGNVVKAMGGAKQGYPVRDAACWRRCRRRRSPPDATSRRGSTTSCAPRSCAVERLTPTIVEVVVRGAGGGARASSPASSTACRTTRRSRAQVDGTPLAMEGLALTGAWVDRSKGLLSTDRARDGRLVRPLRAARAGRAGDPDGPDRHADRDRSRARPSCWPAAGSATPCCSRSARRSARAGIARCSISPATSR